MDHFFRMEFQPFPFPFMNYKSFIFSRFFLFCFLQFIILNVRQSFFYSSNSSIEWIQLMATILNSQKKWHKKISFFSFLFLSFSLEFFFVCVLYAFECRPFFRCVSYFHAYMVYCSFHFYLLFSAFFFLSGIYNAIIIFLFLFI